MQRAALIRAGLRRSLFFLRQRLRRSAVDHILFLTFLNRFVTRTAAAGSAIIFTCIHNTLIESPTLIIPSLPHKTFCPNKTLLLVMRYFANDFKGSFPAMPVSWLVVVMTQRAQSLTP